MRYEKRRLLGRGGIGEVWSARDRATSERVILKISEPAHGQWLRREFELLARGYHPNLPRVCDFGWLPDASGGAYLTSEWISGRSLADLTKLGELDPRSAESALIGALHGLRHLHGLGIVHGDVTPANVLLSQGGEGVLIDLSAAAPIGDPHAPLSGTPPFLSPERLSGHPPAIGDDIYGVGRTFEALGIFTDALPRLTCEAGQRVSSVDTILSLLGVTAQPATHLPLPIPSLSRVELLRDLENQLRTSGKVWIRGNVGSGRSHTLRSLRWRLGPEHNVWECVGPERRWATLLTTIARDGSSAIRTLAIQAQLRLRRERFPCFIYVDDVDTLDPDEQESLLEWIETTRSDDPWRIAVTADPTVQAPNEVIDMPPLSELEISRWLSGSLPPSTRRDIAIASRGRPSDVVELADLVRAGQLKHDQIRKWQRPKGPEPIRRLHSLLDADDHETLGWLCVYAIESIAPLQRRMHRKLPWRRVAQKLVEARYGELEGEHFRWFRPSDAQVVFESVPASRRRRVHDRLATFYSGSRDVHATASYVYHLIRCKKRGDAQRVIEGHLLAGGEVSSEWDRVLQLLGSESPILLRAQLHARRGEPGRVLELILGSPGTVLDEEKMLLVAESCFQLDKSPPSHCSIERIRRSRLAPNLRARAELLAARMCHQRGEYAEALSCAVVAAKHYRDSAVGIQLHLLAELELTAALAAHELDDEAGINASLERALSFFRTLDDAAGIASVAQLRSRRYLSHDEPERADNQLREALGYFEASAEPSTLFESYALLAQANIALDQYGVASDFVSYARAYARTTEQKKRTQAIEGHLRWRLGARTHSLALLQTASGHPFARLPRLLEMVKTHDARRIQDALFEQEQGDSSLWAEVAYFAVDVGAWNIARTILSKLSKNPARFEVEAQLALASEDVDGAKIAFERAAESAVPPLTLADLQACAAKIFNQLGADRVAKRHLELAVEGWERIAASLGPGLRGTLWSERGRREVRQALERQSSEAQLDATRLHHLLLINKRMNRTNRVKEVLDVALDAAVELSGADLGLVLAASGDGQGRLRVASARGANSAELPRDTTQYSRSIARRVLESRATLRLSDALLERSALSSPLATSSIHTLGIRSVLAVLLPGVERDEGVLYLENRRHTSSFSLETEQLMTAFSEQIAIALRNARLVADLRRATRDLERDQGRLRSLLHQREKELQEERRRAWPESHPSGEREALPGVIGQSESIRSAAYLARRFSAFDAAVLIQGESGTGKELFARAIHSLSNRHDQPFVAVNCAAFSEQLLESEFFGHAKGSFTGADSNRDGLFVEANRGTIFLDEVGELPLQLQAKFLRVLQEGEVRRIGESKPIQVDTRVVAATNRDLADEVRHGRFREDLYFRINVFQVRVPPLRERTEDLPQLIDYFLEQQSARHGLPIPKLARSARRTLISRAYPGNIRELQNVLAKAVALCEEGLIRVEDIDSAGLGEGAYLPMSRVEHRETEEIRIQKLLVATGWNVARTARELGVSRTTLYRRIKQMGLTR